MRKSKRISRRYCRQLRSLLPCGWNEKQKLISCLRQQLNAYANEHPNCTEDDLHVRFGTPEDVAVTQLGSMDSSKLLNKIVFRQRVLKITSACVLIALFLWGAVLTHVIFQSIGPDRGYMTVTIEKTH